MKLPGTSGPAGKRDSKRDTDVEKFESAADHILILIGIAQKHDLESPIPLRADHPVKNCQWLDHLTARDWSEVGYNLTETDLVSLLKSLVAIDRQCKWNGGSVSAVIWLFRIYQKRFPGGSHYLANWLLSHASHPLIPFGSDNFGATSMAEYQRRLEQATELDQKRKERTRRERARRETI